MIAHDLTHCELARDPVCRWIRRVPRCFFFRVTDDGQVRLYRQSESPSRQVAGAIVPRAACQVETVSREAFDRHFQTTADGRAYRQTPARAGLAVDHVFQVWVTQGAQEVALQGRPGDWLVAVPGQGNQVVRAELIARAWMPVDAPITARLPRTRLARGPAPGESALSL